MYVVGVTTLTSAAHQGTEPLGSTPPTSGCHRSGRGGRGGVARGKAHTRWTTLTRPEMDRALANGGYNSKRIKREIGEMWVST